MAPKLQGAVQEAACGIASYEEGEKSIFGCNFSGDFPSPRDVARFQFTRKKFLLHQPGKLFFFTMGQHNDVRLRLRVQKSHLIVWKESTVASALITYCAETSILSKAKCNRLKKIHDLSRNARPFLPIIWNSTQFIFCFADAFNLNLINRTPTRSADIIQADNENLEIVIRANTAINWWTFVIAIGFWLRLPVMFFIVACFHYARDCWSRGLSGFQDYKHSWGKSQV